MTKIILIVCMLLTIALAGIMLSAPANAAESTIILSCWVDDDKQDTVIVILHPDHNKAKFIDRRGDMVKGTLETNEYLYTIKITEPVKFGKIGIIKINRFSGHFYSVWDYPKDDDRRGIANSKNGSCIKFDNAGQLF